MSTNYFSKGKWQSLVVKFKDNPMMVILSTIIGLIAIAIKGVIGNRADAWFVSGIPPSLTQSLSIPLWLLIIITVAFFLILLVSITILFLIHPQKITKLSDANDLSIKLNKLDESTVMQLYSLVNTDDIEDLKTRLVDSILHGVLGIFNQKCRIFVMLPDENDEFLEIKHQVGVPIHTVSETKFYIGEPDLQKPKRGLSGNAYTKKELLVANLYKENGEWKSDNPDYDFLPNFGEKQTHRSLLATPIYINEYECLGVLCLDSKEIELFSLESIKGVLESIGNRLALPWLIANIQSNGS